MSVFLFPCFETGTVVPMLEAVMAAVPVEKLAVHFHDTYGQSLPNILVSLQVSLLRSQTSLSKSSHGSKNSS